MCVSAPVCSSRPRAPCRLPQQPSHPRQRGPGLGLAGAVVVGEAEWLSEAWAQVHPLAVDVALDKDDVSVFVHGSKLLLLPNTRTNCCKLCAIDPGRGSVEVFALDNATRSGNGQELMKCGSNLIFIPFDSSGRRCVAEVSVLDCNVLSV